MSGKKKNSKPKQLSPIETRPKRVLWIEDNPQNEASALFPDGETRIVSSMDDAIKEIRSDRLYEYDVVVCDIDFQNGVKDVDQSVKKLKEHIYIDEKMESLHAFVLDNGGYLLYLYLLERGYPSEQVVFLTGNAGMLTRISAHQARRRESMSLAELKAEYKKAYKENSGWVDFYNRIKEQPIAEAYRTRSVIEKVWDHLKAGEEEQVDELLDEVSDVVEIGSDIKNTGDLLLDKFYDANVQPPQIFSKRTYFNPGRDRADAGKWLIDMRTNERMTRWLLLSAGKYVSDLFEKQQITNTLKKIYFENELEKIGEAIRLAFGQLYSLLYGYRDIRQDQQKEEQKKEVNRPLFQAIMAALIPFEAEIQNKAEPIQIHGESDYCSVQRIFCQFSKFARNFGAHNMFGNTVSCETSLFLAMGMLAGILNKNQRKDIDHTWFAIASQQFACWNADPKENDPKKAKKILTDFCEKLRNNSNSNDNSQPQINWKGWIKKDLLAKNAADWVPEDMSKVLMHPKSATGHIDEDYCVFALAGYIVLYFSGLSVEEIESRFGKGIAIMCRLSYQIVNTYHPYEALM